MKQVRNEIRRLRLKLSTIPHKNNVHYFIQKRIYDSVDGSVTDKVIIGHGKGMWDNDLYKKMEEFLIKDFLVKLLKDSSKPIQDGVWYETCKVRFEIRFKLLDLLFTQIRNDIIK